MTSRRRGIGSFVMAALLVAVAPTSPGAADAGCPAEPGARVVVHTAEHRLLLCEGGAAHATYSVRLGSGGVGKTREGDGRTPLGTYPLGAARRSGSYGRFMPIGYPTAAQRRAGNTGGSIGVHGPDRDVRWLGSLVNTFDTTDGCVGIATDDEMAAIATWSRAHQVTTIQLD